MLISELEDHLQKARAAHGDLTVLLTSFRSGALGIQSVTKDDDPADINHEGTVVTIEPPFLLITAED